jgi:hypothetical protein
MNMYLREVGFADGRYMDLAHWQIDINGNGPLGLADIVAITNSV